MHINRQRQLPGADFTNPRLVAMPSSRRHLATSLRMMADPAGRGLADAALIRSRAWPAGPEGAEFPTVDEVETWLLELDEIDWLRLYPDPAGEPIEYFQITARWPRVQKEGETRLPDPPAPEEARTNPPFLTAAVGGASAGERASESAGASERVGLSGSTRHPKLRLPPSPFCSMHRGGPPEGTDCRDCGTARLRNQEHRNLTAYLRTVDDMAPIVRAAARREIESQLDALEEAAIAPPRSSEPDPVEYVDEHGRIDHT